MSIEIIRLSPTTDICPFHCSDKDLNDFLLEDAKKYLSDLMAVTYLFVDADSHKTIAYFSLLNDKVAYNPMDKTIWNRINRLVSNRKRRKSYPSVKIGRLAVSEDCVQSGIGTTILNYIKNKVIIVPLAGCRFLTVDAYANVTDFYQKNGFNFFTSTDLLEPTRLMYFDLKPFKEQIDNTK